MENVQDKINRLKELKTEKKSINKDLEIEMFEFIINKFRNLGFVNDPRAEHGKGYEDGLYHPEMKVSVKVGTVNDVTFGIFAHPMINNGLNWDPNINILQTGGEVNWNFMTQTFEQYFNKKFIKRINKMKGIK